MKLYTRLWERSRMMSSTRRTVLRRLRNTSLTEKMATVEHDWLVQKLIASFALQFGENVSPGNGTTAFQLRRVLILPRFLLRDFRGSPCVFLRSYFPQKTV
jgi:hypothetical protein